MELLRMEKISQIISLEFWVCPKYLDLIESPHRVWEILLKILWKSQKKQKIPEKHLWKSQPPFMPHFPADHEKKYGSRFNILVRTPGFLFQFSQEFWMCPKYLDWIKSPHRVWGVQQLGKSQPPFVPQIIPWTGALCCHTWTQRAFSRHPKLQDYFPKEKTKRDRSGNHCSRHSSV